MFLYQISACAFKSLKSFFFFFFFFVKSHELSNLITSYHYDLVGSVLAYLMLRPRFKSQVRHRQLNEI